jgi:hypothetical protein
MTTPDGSAPEPMAPDAPRVTRPEPDRDGPIRGGPAPAAAAPAVTPATAHVVGAPPPLAHVDDGVSEEIAHAVRLGYDVVAANIKEGRIAAKRFRQGEYNVRDVPRDLNAMTLRLLHLARELSTTTFDVVEHLLRDPNLPGSVAAAAAAASPARHAAAPSVRPVPTAPGFHPTPATAAAAPPATSEPPLVSLTCVFTGSRQAVVKTAMLSRPSRPTLPEQLAATPLAAATAGLAPIGAVSFAAAVGADGVVATIPIPDGQPAGIYSAMIFAPSSDAPLGFVSIEVLG